MNGFDPLTLREVARVTDSHPLRTSCFNADGDYFVLGTNSKSIKICSMHNIVDELLYNQHQGREQSIDVVYEYRNFHVGSVYCLDWSRNNTFIASGSNDRNIRVLKCLDFLKL
jgi:WD40 repeat protein